MGLGLCQGPTATERNSEFLWALRGRRASTHPSESRIISLDPVSPTPSRILAFCRNLGGLAKWHPCSRHSAPEFFYNSAFLRCDLSGALPHQSQQGTRSSHRPGFSFFAKCSDSSHGLGSSMGHRLDHLPQHSGAGSRRIPDRPLLQRFPKTLDEVGTLVSSPPFS